MSRRAALRDAARWAMREDERVAVEPPPLAAADVQATLDDPALAEALAEAAGFGRLSDDDIRAMRATRRRGLLAGGAAALALTVGIGGWSAGWLRPGAAPAAVAQHYETQRGQQLEVALTDGTRLHLNGATSLDVTLGEKQRLVELRRGEAFFDVAHEAERPFLVHAGDAATRVLGTAFDIDLMGGEVRLAVYRGKVRFGGYHAEKGGVVVPAGWRSRFSGGVALAPTRFDASQQDWRQAWLDTDEMRLGDLVEALNRRGGPLIEAPAAALADIPLSGRFKLDNPRQLLEAIGESYGFRVSGEQDRLRLIASGSDDAKSSSE